MYSLPPTSHLSRAGLSLTLAGHTLKRISRARVALWNARGDTVHGSSIVQSDPLRIALDPTDKAALATIVAMSRPQIEVAVKIDPAHPHEVRLDFDFLDAWRRSNRRSNQRGRG